jgi:hypothetical protein
MKRTSFAKPACLALAALALSLPGRSAMAQLAQAKAIELAAHRAVYDLSLDRTGAGSNVSDIRGQLIYDFSGSACQGYTLNTRLVTEIFDRENKPNVTDIRSESQEEGGGRRLKFNTSQYMNDKLGETSKGTAYRGRAPDTITVELEKPKRAQFTLTGNIYFPTQHSLAILKAATAGERRLQADIYDGSEKGAKVYETTTVIGAPLELAANAQLPAIKNSEALDAIQSWPVVVSYYERGQQKDTLPTYEVSFRMYANGVSRKLKLDYGTFSLNGELTAIEFSKTKPCP